jgi:hypothetical protein
MRISQLPERAQFRSDLGQAKLCSLEGGHPSGWCPVFLRPEKGASVPFSCSLLPLLIIDPSLQRLFTDTDMYDTKLREEMEEFYLHLEKIIRVEKLTIPSKKKNYDPVLEIMRTEDQSTQWSYYFASHKARCLFWLEEYDASSKMDGVESPAHVSASPSFTNLPINPLINSCAEHHLEDLYWYITGLLLKLNSFA